MTDRDVAVMPTAAALIGAVATRDADEIARLLHGCDDLYALAVVLANQAALPRRLPAGAGLVFTPEQRRQHHARWAAGERDALTMAGEREYQRESKRRIKQERESGEVLDGGRWVTRRGGVRVWVGDTDRQAG